MLHSYSGSTPVGAAGAGFAFGSKYVGQVAAAVPGAAAAAAAGDAGGARAAAAIIPADLDGELAQQLQKLSKRDATTKLKALQVGAAGGRKADVREGRLSIAVAVGAVGTQTNAYALALHPCLPPPLHGSAKPTEGPAALPGPHLNRPPTPSPFTGAAHPCHEQAGRRPAGRAAQLDLPVQPAGDGWQPCRAR